MKHCTKNLVVGMCERKLVAYVQLCDSWTAACPTALSIEFSRQEYWSGLPFPSPGDLSNPGIEPGSPALQSEALTSEPRPVRQIYYICLCCLLTLWLCDNSRNSRIKVQTQGMISECYWSSHSYMEVSCNFLEVYVNYGAELC